jgi:hypothetical protein
MNSDTVLSRSQFGMLLARLILRHQLALMQVIEEHVSDPAERWDMLRTYNERFVRGKEGDSP